MRNVLITATVPSMIGQFNLNNIYLLQDMGYQVDVAADFYDTSVWDRQRVKKFCGDMKKIGVRCFQINFSRSAWNIGGHLNAYRQYRRLLKKAKPRFIHTHTPVASAIARVAAHQENIRIIYTAHGFHFYKGAALKNWLIYYPVELILSYWTDVLITINKEDYRLAKRSFHAKRTEYVHGVGIDVSKFQDGKIDIEEKRRSLNLKKDDIMLLSVGELSKRKNHEVVIRAIAQLHIAQLKYFICGTGRLKEYLISLIDKLGIQEQVFLLGYRNDISELCQSADIYIFPSRHEELPVALMEAIACKTPVLCSDIRGSNDLIQDEGCMFDAGSVESVAECIAGKLGKGIGSILNSSNQRAVLSGNMKYAVEQNYRNLKKYGLPTVSKEMTEFMGVRHLWYRKCFEEEWCFDSNAVILLSIGELNKNKNHSVVIQALAEMNNSQIHYFIAGSGKLKEKLELLSKKLGIEKQVHLLGYRNDIRYLLQIADIYLLPSRREGLNVSLMEAMASGVPCIVSRIRGNADLILDSKCLVEANDVEGWKCAIKSMAICIQYREMLPVRENGRIIQQYDISGVNEQIKKIYRTII